MFMSWFCFCVLECSEATEVQNDYADGFLLLECSEAIELYNCYVDGFFMCVGMQRSDSSVKCLCRSFFWRCWNAAK